MTMPRLELAVALTLFGCLIPSALPLSADGEPEQARRELPDFPPPVCLGAGLRYTGKDLFAGDQQLPLSLPLPMPKSAAFYAQQGILVTVSADTEVTLYAMKDGKLVEEKRKKGDPVARLEGVHFSRVPGLLYLFWIDTKQEARLKEMKLQEYPDRYGRIALTEEAEKYDAMPSPGDGGGLLTGCYRASAGKRLPFSLKEGVWHELELAEPLDAPFRSGPGDPLAQCVFIFAPHGIICRTKSGWSVNKLDGSLIKQFPAAHVAAMWWADPEVRDGAFFVHARFGPGGEKYRLDMERGELVGSIDFVPTKIAAYETAKDVLIFLGNAERLVELVIPRTEEGRPGVWAANVEKKEMVALLYTGSDVWEKVLPAVVGPVAPPPLPREEMYQKVMASAGRASCAGVPVIGSSLENASITIQAFDLEFSGTRMVMSKSVKAAVYAPPP